ncbi:MerC domain-containing protein [Flavobacterium cupreum]|uniref:MerC domain-containing protein n=1 Tax=Flavobacterium cupreum TaxID=2133766 RepID=A0A434A836_9FLAO|nr:MerC family mercury resistance protein [Flavobacterium cupreum]RUT70551.1 MerC domain-containing protein [Flavobacterium cupreum]
MKEKTTPVYDILGISSATICLVHCLVFPLLTILPLGLSHSPFIDLTFASIGLFSILKIIKKSNLLTASILLISMSLIWISVLSELFFEIHLDLIFIGGIGMIIGHFLNYQSHKKIKNHDTTNKF